MSLNKRASGLLLHPTSLPGPHGCGDLGDQAYRFVDFLKNAGQRWWQMLPVSPSDHHGCPYSACSSFAGAPILISLHRLHQDGLLARADIAPLKNARPDRLDYLKTRDFRSDRLRKAFDAFMAKPARSRAAMQRFHQQNKHWLDDWTLFCACREAHAGKHWWKWETGLRLRRKPYLDAARKAFADEIAYHLFVQYQFDKQWSALKKYATRQGVGLIGDIPIFVAHDSCDVWANPQFFRLNADSMPTVISGAAPDAFSKTGQLWEHPLYHWPRHKATGYDWWAKRFRHTFTQFDAVRVDHFLGFCRFWEIPFGDKNAKRGRWRKGPGADLFLALKRKLGDVPIIVEDLGLLTQQAQDLRDRFGFPGMRLLQEAFGEDDSYHAPHNHPTNCVVYTATHDNNTAQGWFANLSKARSPKGILTERQRALACTAGKPATIHRDLIRLALSSVANTAILPVQDLLGLDAKARMNTPGTKKGNWSWRLKSGQLTKPIARRLAEETKRFGRI